MGSESRSWRKPFFETSRAQWEQERARGPVSYIQGNALARAVFFALAFLVLSLSPWPGSDPTQWWRIGVRALIAGILIVVFVFLYAREYRRLARKYGEASESSEGESTPR